MTSPIVLTPYVDQRDTKAGCILARKGMGVDREEVAGCQLRRVENTDENENFGNKDFEGVPLVRGYIKDSLSCVQTR